MAALLSVNILFRNNYIIVYIQPIIIYKKRDDKLPAIFSIEALTVYLCENWQVLFMLIPRYSKRMGTDSAEGTIKVNQKRQQFAELLSAKSVHENNSCEN